MVMEEDYYATLDVAEEATHKEIKKAFRTLSLKWHPDKNRDNPTALEVYHKIIKAHEILSDEKKKADYDSTLHMKKAKKRKEAEMDSTRKKMMEKLEKSEKEGEIKKEERRKAKAQKTTEDMSWLTKNKAFKIPKYESPPGGAPAQPSGPTTVQIKWSRKKTHTREDIMETFKRFGEVDLVVLKESEGGGRPSALISYKNPASAQAAYNSNIEGFKVSWPKTQPTPAPTPPKQQPSPYQPHTPQSPYTFTSPFGTAFPSPSSPFGFTSPLGNPFAAPAPSRSAAELDDFEMQTLMKLQRAAQVQKEQTPTSTPDKKPPSTPQDGVTPKPSVIDVDSPTFPRPTPISPSTPTPLSPSPTPIDLTSPPSYHPPVIDVDASTPQKASPPTPSQSTPPPSYSSPLPQGFAYSSPPPTGADPADYESVSQMKARRAAERQRIIDEMSKM